MIFGKKILLIISLGFVSLMFSCRSVFNGVVAPNQCKKCDVINRNTGAVVWSNEGCGAENTQLLEKAKQEAYDMSRTSYDLCDLEVICVSWKKDPENVE